MAKFKKIIPALCMLVVSAIMAVSTTYAWFSMNNTVKATGMEVTAKSNAEYFVISNNSTLGTDISLTLTSASSGGVNDDKTSVYPCAKATSTNAADLSLTVGDWYTANSTKVDDAASLVNGTNADATNIKKIDSGDLSKYQLTYEFYVGFTSDSVGMTNGTLTVKATNYTNLANGTSAVVSIVDGNGSVDLSSSSESGNITGLNFTPGQSKKVTVIVYMDGNNENIKGYTATSLSGTLALEFTIAG